MKIDGNTKVLELLESNPHLLDVLVGISPEFGKLRNPILRKTIGRLATLEHASKMSGIPLDDLCRKISEAMIHGEPPGQTAVQTALSPQDRAARTETLKGIIRALHDGKDVESQKKRFSELVKDVSPGEIAQMEQALMAEGMPAEEIRRLCDVHVSVFSESLDRQPATKVPPGHPVSTFRRENAALGEAIDRVRFILGASGATGKTGAQEARMAEFYDLMERLGEVEKHYLRKENQLFPVLEDHGITAPSRVMWAIHDDIRGLIKAVRADLAKGDAAAAEADGLVLATAMSDMIYKEENILFPMAMETLSEAEWERVRRGGEQIGYALIEPETGWEPDTGERGALPPARHGSGEAPLWLSTGGMTPAQVDLLLTHLPVDVTFVDAQDRVQYYSDGRGRIFPRSPGIIGRAVQNCHPPKSLHIVEKLLAAFRAGEKDSADFWIRMGGRLVSIRYFAVRDKEGRYVGCLEVSQDVTGFTTLQGEKRLLDW